MASRFWVTTGTTGGTGNWSDTQNWSATSGGTAGASVPGSSDTATFNANSGSGTATVDSSVTIQTLTCTGFTGTLAFGTNTISLNSTGTIFTGATTMTVTGTPLIICTNNSATARTISPQAVTEANSISFRVTAGTGGFTVTTTHAVRDLDFTDGTNPTGFAGAYGNVSNTIYGSFKASTGMTRTAGTGTLTFAATSGTETVNTAGVTFDCPFTFNGVGGTFQLASALTSGSSRTCTLTNGTLDLASYTLTAGLFSSSNSNARTLAFGTGNITITGNAATVFSISDSTNLTISGTPNVNFTYSGSTGTRVINASLTSASENTALNYTINAGSDIVSFGTASRFAKNVNFTGFSGTILELVKNIFGNLTLPATTLSVASSSTVTFRASSGTQQITTNGKSFDFPVTIDAPGATVQLQDALTMGATRTLTHTAGTFTTNGYAVTAGAFSSSNTNARTLNLGASTVTLTGTGTSWNITDPTNMTLNAGTSLLSFTGSSGNLTMQGGGLTYYNVTFGATYYNNTLAGTNTFNNLTIASPAAAGRRSLALSNNQTVNGTLTMTGSAANSRPRITGVTGGTTITAAAVSLSDADFSNITAAGTSSPWSGTRLGDIDGNTNITFATPKTVYWNQPAGGNWSDVAWATSSGGSVGANNFPLPQDTAILDNAGVGAFSTIVMDYGWGFQLNAGSLTSALTINWNCFSNLTAGSMGDFTLSSAVTITYTAGSLGFNSLGSLSTITTAGVTIPIFTTTFNSAGNTFKLADNFTSTGTNNVGLVAGTLDLNGNTLTCVVFDSTFTDLEPRVIAFNGGQINVTGNATTVWACEDLTNFSYTGTPTVNFTYSGSTGTRTINNGATGATESNVVDFNVTAGSDQWTATANNSVRNLNFTGFSGVTGLFGAGFIYGNLTLSPTQTVTASSNSTTFAATSGTKTITTNGVTIDRSLTFNGVGGTWSLQDALTLGATRDLGLFAGTLTTNGYSVSCGRFNASDAGATGSRTLNLGSSSFILAGTSTSTMSWQIEETTYPFTLNAGTSIIYMSESYSGTSTQDFIGGGKSYCVVSYIANQPSTIYGNNTFQSLTNSAKPLALTFEAGSTQTIDSFTVSGTSGNLVTMTSSVPGTQWYLAKSTSSKVLVSYCSITDSAASPIGYWFAPTSQGNVDGGNNTGWNFGSSGENSNFFMLM